MKLHYLLYSLLPLATACTSAPDYDATGIFEATTVTVSAETSGKILALDVNEGDTVRAGQSIACIDSVILTLQQNQIGSQRRSAESSAPDIQVQVAALRTRIAHQREELDRQERLLADGATTQKQYDDTRSALLTLQGELEAQLSALGKSRTTISDNATALGFQQRQVAEQINRSTVISPLTGTVLTKYAERGEYANPGKPLVKIADLDNIYLRCYFTASQLADIKLGQEVTVIADFGADKQYEYPGHIIWIAEESEFTPKSIQTRDSRANLVYAAKVAVKNDGRLKLGQYGEVKL